MSFRFYIGEDEHEVCHVKASHDAAAHYAWCLNELLQGIEHVKSDEAKLALINQFEMNMKLLKHTNLMLKDVEGIIALLKQTRPLPDNESLMNYLKGMPVGEEQYYIGYTRKL